MKESEKNGKAYAVFEITVRKREPHGREQVWDVYRRYNDFHDLHRILLDKVAYFVVTVGMIIVIYNS